MPRRHVDDHSLEQNNLVAFSAIVEPTATVLAIPDFGGSMTDWSERDGGSCSANTDAALACLVDRIVSINQKETKIGHSSRWVVVGKLYFPPYPHRAVRWSGPPGQPYPTVMYW